MTNDEMRVAVAEACGWTPEVRRKYAGEANVQGWGRNVNLSDGHVVRQFVTNSSIFPDYCNDLNAAREAAIKLFSHDEAFRDQFMSHLHDVIERDNEFDFSGSSIEGRFWVATASANQVSEAVLRTLNKWKD